MKRSKKHGMECPRCHSKNSFVVDSRTGRKGKGIVRRRRHCQDCGHRFTTHEEVFPNKDREQVLQVLSRIHADAAAARAILAGWR